MKRPLFLILFFAMLPAASESTAAGSPAAASRISAATTEWDVTPAIYVSSCYSPQDSLGKQILYNGRVWRNLYQHIDGTQFYLTSDFLQGSVTINGMTFNNPDLKLKLDLVNDELLLMTDRGSTLQLNKQMVESFTLIRDKREMLFRNLEADSLSELNGYVNVIHDGKTPLYVRYKKEIRLRDAPGDRDTFIQTYRIYLVKDGIAHQVRSRQSLMKLLKDHKAEVNDFIRTNHVQITRNSPESFTPVLEYYDKLK